MARDAHDDPSHPSQGGPRTGRRTTPVGTPKPPIFLEAGAGAERLAGPVPITLHVNGQDVSLEVPVHTTLLDALREAAGLTGTKKGCDHGQCGACTLLIDGRRVCSCLTLAIMHQSAAITTVEGLASETGLHPLQQAFIRHDAFQCGYCTPGQLCSAVGLLNEQVDLDAEQVRRGMSGNLCRCGAYPNIVSAILEVSEARSVDEEA